MRRAFLCLVGMIAAVAQTRAEGAPSKAEAPRPEILVLGVYHMANPGRDVYNLQADDVLSPKRQQEIAELAAVLKRFRPTKIAVESNYGEDAVPKRYAEYLAGTHELTRNEREQIGFRVAKELGHTAIYGADADGDFPLPHVFNYAKATGQSAKLDAHMAEVGEAVKALDQYLTARYGEPGDYAGPDLLAEWYRRNVRIYNNVARLVTSPEDRILVIFGSGHLGWLRQEFAADPTLRLRKLEEFAPAASREAEGH